MTLKRIAIIPGDGVGPEVIRESEKVLCAIADLEPRIDLSMDRFPWGTTYYLETGQMMPHDGMELLSGYDAILFGAVGSPSVKDHITLRGLLLRIRFEFDQYVNLRPVRLLPGIECPLRDVKPTDIDMIFVREGTEGEYAGLGDLLAPHTEREVALQTSVFSRRGTERVIRWAFALASHENRSVTSVSKANALQYSGVLWDDVFAQVSDEYPDVEAHSMLVDAAAMFMVREPQRFGVVVASNLFADILTDLGAALMGGMGVAPSANLNPNRMFPSMFEPIHGSAPDLEGSGSANPVGSIWSVAMMFDFLGFPDKGDRVRRAIERTVLDPATRTRDIGGHATTSLVGDAIAREAASP